jgi:NAD(P)-dependent dehydrogenase (short-subunit alcohol dehydrogenase family)
VSNAFRDKVAIVTGGASGLGRALCEELARQGARVVVADIDAAGAERTAAALGAAGGRAEAERVDVASEEAVFRLVASVAARHGSLDYMFNNAGIAVGGEAHDLTTAHWKKALDVNLWGTVFGTSAAYAVMRRQGHGHIVNTASVGGLVPMPLALPYAASKHAIVGLSTTLRIEAKDSGIKVSVLCPAFIETRILENATFASGTKDDFRAAVRLPFMEAGRAARLALKGVARNRAVVVLPFYGRLMWWLHRLQPALLTPGFLVILRGYRKNRKA